MNAMHRFALRLLAVAFLMAATSAGAQMYRWTDEKGRVHYTSTPPPAGAKGVQKKDGGAAPSPPGSSQPGNLPFAVQQAQKDFPLTLYVAADCDGCQPARGLLNARGLPFKEVLVADEAQIAELKSATGSATVPTLVVGRTPQLGFEAGAWNRALDAAGYPKAGVLPARSQAAAPAVPAEPAAPAPKPAARGPYAPK
jgi:glutaredoxin